MFHDNDLRYILKIQRKGRFLIAAGILVILGFLFLRTILCTQENFYKNYISNKIEPYAVQERRRLAKIETTTKLERELLERVKKDLDGKKELMIGLWLWMIVGFLVALPIVGVSLIVQGVTYRKLFKILQKYLN